MTKRMNDDIFDFILSHALMDCQIEDINRVKTDSGSGKATFSETFENFFKKVIRKRKHKRFISSLPKYSFRAWVSAATTIAVFSCFLIIQPPVYAAVKSVFYEWFDDHVRIQLAPSDVKADFVGVKLNYVPDGFSLVQAIICPSGITTIDYDGTNNFELISLVIVDYYGDFEGNVDNEHGTIQPLEIDGATDIMYIKSILPDYPSHVMWSKENLFYQLLCPYSLTDEQIINLIENIELIY